MLASSADATFGRMPSSSLVVSVGAHAVAIGLAVFLTAKTGDSHQMPPKRPAILIYQPAPTEPVRGVGSGSGTTTGRPFPTFTAPRFDGPGLPEIDMPSPGALVPMSGADTVWDLGGSRGGGRQRPDGVLSADLVDVAAAPLPGGLKPRYPEALRAAGIEGRATLEFVVDTTGRIDPGSIRVIASDADAFVVSIRDALAATRYHAALVGGRPVRQLVRQEFAFALTR
jgi:periplasmic protein TonB